MTPVSPSVSGLRVLGPGRGVYLPFLWLRYGSLQEPQTFYRTRRHGPYLTDRSHGLGTRTLAVLAHTRRTRRAR